MKMTTRIKSVMAVFALILGSVGCKKTEVVTSPELEAARARFKAIANEPLRKGIDISQESIVEDLHLDAPFKDSGEAPVLGFPQLITLNENAGIEVRINGPKENLWSVGVRAVLEAGRIGVGQESQGLVGPFVAKIDPSAWAWITHQVRESSEHNFEVQKVQKTFGSRQFSLWINPPSVAGPATVSILILPAS